MGDQRQALSDSELEFDMEFSFSASGSSPSISSHTLDSGVSTGVHSNSDDSLSLFEFDRNSIPSIKSSEDGSCFLSQNVLFEKALESLVSHDPNYLANACAYFFQLCKIGCGALVIRSCPELMDCMLCLVSSPGGYSIESLHFLSGVMHYLSLSDDCTDYVLSSSGVQVLSYFLTSPMESVLYYAVTAIHSLLLARGYARNTIRNSCVVDRLIILLNMCTGVHLPLTGTYSAAPFLDVNPKFLAVLCDCIHILAYGHETTKRLFLEHDALRSLLHLITSSRNEKVLWTASRLLRVLSAWMPVKREIFLLDPSLDFLSSCLASGSFRVTASALWTLRNLSDLASGMISTNVVNLVLDVLFSQLELRLSCTEISKDEVDSPDAVDWITLCRCIFDIIGNLTCGNRLVKSYLVKSNRIEPIVKAMQSVLDMLDIDTLPKNPNQEKKTDFVLCESMSQLSIKTPPKSAFRLNINPRSRSGAQGDAGTHRNLFPNFKHSHSDPCAPAPDRSHDPPPPCTTPPIYASRTLCCPPPLLSRLPCTVLTTQLDLLEAGFRCLAHLTAGHTEVMSAGVCFLHQRASSRLLDGIVIQLFIPLLFPSSNTHSESPRHQPLCGADHACQVLQVIRTWATFLGHLLTVCSTELIRPHNKSTTAQKHLKSLSFSHLRRHLLSLMEQLNRRNESTREPSKDLVTVRELITRLLTRMASSPIDRASVVLKPNPSESEIPVL